MKLKIALNVKKMKMVSTVLSVSKVMVWLIMEDVGLASLVVLIVTSHQGIFV